MQTYWKNEVLSLNGTCRFHTNDERRLGAKSGEIVMRWLAGSILVLVLACSTAMAADANAAPVLVQTQITLLRTGWNADQFAIATVAPISNPAGCPSPDGYISDENQPGYQTMYAAALLAFAERATVVVIVSADGCIANRPQLIGLDITR
jgi:hypothetical protein